MALLKFSFGAGALRRTLQFCAVFLAFISLATAAMAQTPGTTSTLAKVRARGNLICATSDPLPGFAQQNKQGLWSGFDVDFCRAVAAAVFGDPAKVEFRALSGDSRFAPLQTGAVDLIARNASWTMRRDTSYGANFVAASFYDGQGIMVPQAMNAVSAYELNKVSICVLDGGDDQTNLRDFFFQTQAAYSEVLYEDREDLKVAYQAGLCNAVSAPASWLYAIRGSLPDPATQRILPERLSKEAFGPVVRTGDDQWFSIVQWTLFALVDAEEVGITSLNIGSLTGSKTHSIRRMLGVEGDFGPSIGLSHDFIRNIVQSVGNYGEIFDRNFGADTGSAVLRGQNALWTKGGLLFAPPVE
ncbi:MAG: Glutamate/glutamine/aspartate/asparagine transporter, periplasmic substrate-binding protein [Hyphomicrobiales bacterium]|nr:Glutamate/glutamine/aspartate/asparagine transporter, periplasmic substrate-binding protein [Hyphomicrobiales bacterium]